MNLDDRIVVTGIGAVTPLGKDVPSTWNSLIKGDSAVSKDSDGDYLSARISGLEGNFFKKHSAVLRMAVAEAIDMARLPRSARGLFILCQSKLGGEIFEDFWWNLYGAPSYSAVIGDFDFGNKIVKNIVGACSGGIQAIFSGVSSLMTHAATLDFAVIGVAETSIYPIYVSSFARMGVLSNSCVRPFDKKRDGFAIGEGAAAIVIERKCDISESRHPLVLAEICGIYSGSSSDIVDIGKNPASIVEAIRSASYADEKNSFLNQIDYVHAHGTATKSNDFAEAMALKDVFGRIGRMGDIAVSSTKAATGHLLGASGILGVVFSICAIRDKKVPPTLNLNEPISDEIDFVPNRFKDKNIRRALVLAYGFGAQIGAITVGKPL